MDLKEKNYQNRKVGIMENGTWAPNSAKCMKQILSSMKNIEIVEPTVTIRSTLKEKDLETLTKLSEEIMK